MKKIILATIVSMMASQAFGLSILPNPFVQDTSLKYKTVQVQAYEVEGVYISLKSNIVKADCNARSIILDQALVSGTGDGYYDRYILDGSMLSTQMYCPLTVPEKETIFSERVFIKSFTNENVSRTVNITLIIPVDYDLDVENVGYHR